MKPEADKPVQVSALTLKELRDKKAALELELSNIKQLIEIKKQEQVETISAWVAWISLIASFSCLVASIFTIQYIILPRVLRYSAYILAGVSALAFTVPVLYIYILPISLIVVAIVVLVGIWCWKKDKNVLNKVVANVEETKHEIRDYKNKFKKRLNDADNKWIDNIKKSKAK